jgi:hypothetical protein
VQGLLRWRKAVRARRQLLELDDRMLRDIGLTREDVLFAPRAAMSGALSSSRERNTAVKTMVLTVMIVLGSFAVAIWAAEERRPISVAGVPCALFHPDLRAGYSFEPAFYRQVADECEH